MDKYGISRYEELIKKYKNEVTYNSEIKINELYIINDTGLNIDKDINFDILDGLKIIDIEKHLFDKVIVTIDCRESQCDSKFIQFEFEEIMTCNGYKSSCKRSINFVYLKEGFRLEFTEKKKNNKSNNTNCFEIEAKILTIRKVDIDEYKSKNSECEVYDFIEFNRKKTAKNLHTRWNINYKQAFEAINTVENGEKPYFMYDGLLKDCNCGFDKEFLDNLGISDDLKYFLYDLVLTETIICSYGKNYKNDEFFLILKAFDGSKYILIAIKFKDIISLNLDDNVGGYIDYWYDKIHYDKSYELSLGTSSDFINIHAKDIEIEFIVDCYI